MAAVAVGANIGCLGMFMARRVAPGGTIIAIEPQQILIMRAL